MMFYAGPCLLNDNQEEIDNALKTAEALHNIDSSIRFRCKLWGGGTTPERYVPGIGAKGIDVLENIAKFYIDPLKKTLACRQWVGTEVQSSDQLKRLANSVAFIWIGARNSQNYALLAEVGGYLKRNRKNLFKSNRPTINEVLIKRSPGMTIDEVIGLHDICAKKYDFKPVMIERGINSFTRLVEDRWISDFDSMIRLLRERPDIQLGFDPSHAGGLRENVFPLVRAAAAIGIKRFMLEVYDDPRLTQTDKAQAISISEFKKIYEYVKNQEAA